jgi:hypothetical protein
MTELFDVFRQDGDGLLWIGAEPTIERAVERARKDMEGKRGSCEYLLLDLKTGGKKVIRIEQSDTDATAGVVAKMRPSQVGR